MTQRPRIYLDHAATTPILPAAKAAMVEAMERWANPSSPHAEGRAARAALEDARERIKRALGWTGELIFTSGATEAIEIALAAFDPGEVAASAVEHDAVLRANPDRPRISVDRNGRVDPGALPPKWLIVVQAANNETGVRQPVAEIAAAVRDRGGVFLCDCAQTAGKFDLPDADMIAVSAHKLGGPPGIGALLVRDLSLLKPRGGQERGYRGGTENLPAILGFAAAVEAPRHWLEGAASLRAALETRLLAAGAEIIGDATSRIAAIGCYRMPGVSSAVQLIQFDALGFAVSAGSACASGAVRPSHVLRAMGVGPTGASEIVRVSFGPQTTTGEVEALAEAWEQLASRRRAA